MTLFDKPLNDSLYERSVMRDTFIDNSPAINEKDLPDIPIVGYIYTITQNTTGKIYIGQTQKYRERGAQHLRDALLKDTKRTILPIDMAMHIEGIENFTMRKLWACTSLDELFGRELQFIAQFDSSNPENGYNQNRQLDRRRYGTGQCVWDTKPISIESRRARSRRVVAINLVSQELYVAASLKLLGEAVFGKGRDIMAHAAKMPHMTQGFSILYFDGNIGTEVTRRQSAVYARRIPGRGQCIPGRDEQYRLLYESLQTRNFKMYYDSGFSFYEVDFDTNTLGFCVFKLKYNEEDNSFTRTINLTDMLQFPILRFPENADIMKMA